uniref:Mini-chromosome maintenance complex-binding protein n=1 Tax=Cacopsylla melanoneura TaxID=428564 RepID=A0A8D8YNC6_9HEMI
MDSWTPKYWQEHEQECEQILKDVNSWDQVPELHSIPSSELKDGMFVKYRGMIQDMMNPVFYFDKYEVLDRSTQSKSIHSGRFKESLHCLENEEFLMDSRNNVNDERRSLYCISIPGLNSWAKPALVKPNTSAKPTSSQSESSKRSVEDEVNPSSKRMHTDDVDCEMKTAENSRIRQDGKCENKVEHKAIDLNLPIPDDTAKACLVTIYKDLDSYLVNQIIEVVGFLCIDPPPLKSDQDEMDLDQDHLPPSSLAPRVHATTVRCISQSNPLLKFDLELSAEEITNVRKDLKLVLTQLLMGDDVAAEYLICYLLSRVYTRDNVGFALGKFSLNLFHKDLSSSCADYGKMMYEILKLMLTKSHYFELSVKSLNETTMIPKKDYSTNRLQSGLLQLSPSTYLILDETHLQPGQLNHTGCLNVKALSSVVSSQRMSYDFQFYDGTFPTDIPVLALSDSKSMLPSDCHLKLKPDSSCTAVIQETFAAATQYLKPDLLNRIRVYISWIQNRNFEIPDNLTEIVQKDFVEMRKQNKKTDANDLHTLIVLARLLSLSFGHTELTEDMWKLALSMEKERKSR